MKFKLDENFGPSVHEVFLRRGLDCHTVHEEGLTGADDPKILGAAVADHLLVGAGGAALLEDVRA